MVTVTADDIRVLAQDNSPDPVLALVDDQLVVLPAAEVRDGARIVYTKTALLQEWGVDVTEVEAQLAAGNLTAALTRTE